MSGMLITGSHIVATRSVWLQDFEHFLEPHTVTTSDGKVIDALGMGSILKKTNRETFVLNDVCLVPNITKNLFGALST